MNRPLYLLCGGQSRRMGADDKALLPFGAEPLLDVQLRKAAPHFRSVTLLSGENRYDRPVRQLPDAFPEAGPLAGLLSALRDAPYESLAVIPVDVPLLSEQTLAYLATHPLPEGANALVAASEERIHPLVGIFATQLAPELERFLKEQGRSVLRFVERIGAQPFAASEEELFNVNTRADYARLLKRMR